MYTRWLFVFALLAAGCEPAVNRPAPPPSTAITAHLYSDGPVSIDRGSAMSLEQLNAALLRAAQRVEASGNEVDDIVFTLTADGQATCGMLKDVINTCQRCRIENFALKFASEHPFRMPLARPAGEFGPIELRIPLQVHADGSLAGIKLIHETFASPEAFQRKLIALLGDDRGPGSAYETTCVEFVADDQLQIAELARVYAVMSYVADDGQRLLVAKHVSPLPAFEDAEKFAEPTELDVELVPIE